MSAATQAERKLVTLPAHLPALDGLRGLAILLVVAHMLGLYDAPASASGRALSFFFATGWIGVQLFFVLSGFLITGILLDTSEAPGALPAFYARRFLRIFPLYYGTLFVAFVVLPAFGPVPAALEHDRAHQGWLWAYLANWLSTTDSASRAFPHFWSLAVEEQFYLLWPLALRGLSPQRCLSLGLGVAAAALGARVGLMAAGVSRGAIYTFSITRMDALALGGAAAALMRIPAWAAALVAARRRLPLAAVGVFVVGALVTRGYALGTFAGGSVGYSLLALSFTLAVLGAAGADVSASRSWFRAAPLRTLGKYSYAIYVFHKPLHDFAGKPLLARLGVDAQRSALVATTYVGAGLVVSFAAAYASYHLYEKHFLRWKARFVPRLAEAKPLE
ncbi:MAG TPA: acyltransferase [Polyangia bacterium]|jgi:peptidoglycan/LPS O-acetylase OafA/YrhL|nr:acyltransferase [Polyangia bacterium]